MPDLEGLDRLIAAAWNRGDLEEHRRLTEMSDRVAARRAADARRAGTALDALLAGKVPHYSRGMKWFTNLGDVETCNCGEPWPHNCSE